MGLLKGIFKSASAIVTAPFKVIESAGYAITGEGDRASEALKSSYEDIGSAMKYQVKDKETQVALAVVASGAVAGSALTALSKPAVATASNSITMSQGFQATQASLPGALPFSSGPTFSSPIASTVGATASPSLLSNIINGVKTTGSVIGALSAISSVVSKPQQPFSADPLVMTYETQANNEAGTYNPGLSSQDMTSALPMSGDNSDFNFSSILLIIGAILVIILIMKTGKK